MDITQDMHVELRRIAVAYLRREVRGHTHQPTSLVNEACLRLHGNEMVGRSELLGIAARVMRQVLVDHARRRMARKRAAGGVRVPLTPDVAPAAAPPSHAAESERLIALDAALEELARVDADLAEIVELRYFGGLSEVQAAAHLGVSVRTVSRRLHIARLFLARQLGRAG